MIEVMIEEYKPILPELFPGPYMALQAHPEIVMAFWMLVAGLIVVGASWSVYRRIKDMGILGRVS
jgi:hypothetical protein